MPEGTIFQDQISIPPPANPTVSPMIFANKEKIPSSRFPLRRLINLGSILLVVFGILFVILNIILPRFNNSGQKTVILSYWGIKEDPSTLSPIISEFEKENPNIKIEYTRQDLIDYREKLTTRIDNGTGPDIFKFHNSWYPMLRDHLLPLPQETIEKREFSDSFYNVSQKDLIKNGAIYGIPLGIDTLVMYVNTKIFDEEKQPIPTTWQEFIEASTKLTKRDETGRIISAGAGIGTFENVTHAPDIVSLLFAQNGVDIKNPVEYEEKISDALRFYTNFALVENSVWDPTLDSSLIEFSQGRLAMFFGYYWDYFEIKKANPNLSFKIMPVPQLLLDSRFNIASYWAEGISAKSKNQKEALLFMKFLAKKETAKRLYREQSKARGLGEPYANKTLAEELKNTEDFVSVDQAKTAVSSPFIGGTYDNGLNDRLNSILGQVILDILGNRNTESGTGTLIDGYYQIVSDYAPKPTK